VTVTKGHYVERLMGRIVFTVAFCCFNAAPGHQPAKPGNYEREGWRTSSLAYGVSRFEPSNGYYLSRNTGRTVQLSMNRGWVWLVEQRYGTGLEGLPAVRVLEQKGLHSVEQKGLYKY
jgi:hypothetical protein